MNSRCDRAKLFMPFNSLRGYYDMILEAKRETVPRRELCEDDAAELSDKLNVLEKGMEVTVTCYDTDCYREIRGMVAEVDKVFRRLTVVRTVIPFDDISGIDIIA